MNSNRDGESERKGRRNIKGENRLIIHCRVCSTWSDHKTASQNQHAHHFNTVKSARCPDAPINSSIHPSIYPSIHQSIIYLPIYPSIYPLILLSTHISLHLTTHPTIQPSINLSTHLSSSLYPSIISLPFCLAIYLSI